MSLQNVHDNEHKGHEASQRALHKLIRCDLRALRGQIVIAFAAAIYCMPAAAQNVAGDQFADKVNGAKRHVASGFVCPPKIGIFERDAVGETNPQTGADFCAYSALDGVYGTITLFPLEGAYDPKQALADDFAEQEGTGGKKIGESTAGIAAGDKSQPLAVYMRNYETAKLEELHYRVTYTGAGIGSWAVETTLEYAEPRDENEVQQFLRAVYADAEAEIGRPR
jgi:hypothetical protein